MIVPSASSAVTSSAVGQGGALDDQAVVAGGLERRGQAGEDAGAAVADGAELAVHDLAGADHLAAEGLADRLVAEADAEERRAGLGGGGDQREADAGLVGVQGPGESRIAEGLSAIAAWTSISSLRRTIVSAPSSPR